MTRRRLALVTAGSAWVWLWTAAPASAQTPNSPPSPAFVRTLDFGAAVSLAGGVSYGTASANLIAPDGSTLTLFKTSNSLGAAKGVEVHVGLRLRPRLDLEVTGSWRRANLRSEVSGDFEGAADTHLTTATSQFSVEGSTMFRLAKHGRMEPFVRVGLGWMRQITADAALARDASIANAGAGVKYWWRDSAQAAIKRLGLRFEARMVVRSGGIALSKRSVSVRPAVAVGMFFGF